MKVFGMFVTLFMALICSARVSFGDGVISCDGLACPKNSFSCDVNVRNDPGDAKQVVRERKCLSKDGKVLQQQVVKGPNTSGGTVSNHAYSFSSSGGGHELTPEEAEQFLRPPSVSSQDLGGNWFYANSNP